MHKKKKLDCVALKQEIQNKMEREFRGLKDDERNNAIMRTLKNNPLFENLFEDNKDDLLNKKEAA